MKNDRNYGTAYTRYNGFRHSSGKFIFMVDADDIVPENSLAEIL